MKNLKLAISIATSTTIAIISMVQAQAKNAQDHKIFVYEDCKQVAALPMTDEQLNAYYSLKEQERVIERLQLPLESMESELEVYSEQLDELDVDNDASYFSINEEQVRKHVEIAEKMQSIVTAYQPQIDELESQAREIEKYAYDFEKLIRPSIEAYDGDDVMITISDTPPDWECGA